MAGGRFSLDLARPSRQHWLGYILLAPAVLLIAAIIIYPLFVSVDLSFQNVGIARLDQPRRPFTTANYERLFTSRDFWNACWVTLKLILVVTTACCCSASEQLCWSITASGSCRGAAIRGHAVGRAGGDCGGHLRLDL